MALDSLSISFVFLAALFMYAALTFLKSYLQFRGDLWLVPACIIAGMISLFFIGGSSLINTHLVAYDYNATAANYTNIITAAQPFVFIPFMLFSVGIITIGCLIIWAFYLWGRKKT